MSRLIRFVLQCNLFKAFFLLLLLWLSGCARLPVSGEIPPGASLHRIAKIEADVPFAPSPAGDRVALADDGLRVLDPLTGKTSPFSAETPLALAWSPNGKRLAAAFAGGNGTRLRIFDAAGEPRNETTVDGRVARMLWLPGGDLLTAAVRMETFSFGGEHRTLIYRWNGSDEPVKIVEHTTVAKPRTLHDWGDYLYRTIRLELSPLGDEVLYTRLHDPPAFSPYLKVILRHIGTGQEQELANVTLASDGAVFAPDETVVYGDGSGSTRRIDPWTKEERKTWSSPGRSLSTSEGGRYLLIDGRLYRDGEGILTFPPESEGRFAGGRLFIRHERGLYLLEGLDEDVAADLAPEAREQLLKLRRWRSNGLITHEEYIQQKRRIFEP